MASIGQKRKLADEEISKYLSTMTNDHLDELDISFSAETLSEMVYAGEQLVITVAAIAKLPSKFAAEEFKRSTKDTKLLKGFQDPYVKLVLDLKQLYDLRALPLFETLLKFKKEAGVVLDKDPVHKEHEALLQRFFDAASLYLPDLPEIKDPVLAEAFFSTKPTFFTKLIGLGKRFYQAYTYEILDERFSEQEVEEFTLYTEDIRLATFWNSIYRKKILANPDDLLVPYFDNFYAYIGALVKAKQYEDIKTFLTILLEPLIQQFPFNESSNVDSVSKVSQAVPDAASNTIHVFTDPKGQEVYVVQFKYKSFVLGTGSSDKLVKAEANAAENVLAKSVLIESIKRFQHPEIGAQQGEPLPFESSINRYQQQQQMGAQAQVQPQSTTYMVADQQNAYSAQFGAPLQQQQLSQVHSQVFQPSQLPIIPPALVTDTEPIGRIPPYEFEDPQDESLIDNSSKQQLNDKLIANKLPTAEYKTSKVSNSEVKVMCRIANIPIAFTISTNKKKAGQCVAQNVLKYFDWFMGEDGHQFLDRRN